MSDPWVPVAGGGPGGPAPRVPALPPEPPHPAAPAGSADLSQHTAVSQTLDLAQDVIGPPADAGASRGEGLPGDAAPGDTPGPFDPAGVVWQPVSPRLVTVRLISAGVTLAVPLVGGGLLAALTGVPGLWAIPAAVAVVAVLTAVVIPRQVRAIGYAEREDDLLIRKGVLLRTLVVVPYGRMQFVDVQAGPLDRWGGIARVQLHTASPGSDAAIPGLPPAEAARMRDRLAARGEAQLAGL